MPNVASLVSIFQSYLPAASRQYVDTELLKTDPTLAYQNAAAFLKVRAGDAVVARALREATLHACQDVQEDKRRAVAGNLEECERLETQGRWAVPRGYRMLARLLASGKAGARPAIITTNFDPLIEIALRAEGHIVSPVPIPTDTAPSPDQIRANPGIPVMHMHGFWLSPTTLNTVTQLTRPRPKLARVPAGADAQRIGNRFGILRMVGWVHGEPQGAGAGDGSLGLRDPLGLLQQLSRDVPEQSHHPLAVRHAEFHALLWRRWECPF